MGWLRSMTTFNGFEFVQPKKHRENSATSWLSFYGNVAGNGDHEVMRSPCTEAHLDDGRLNFCTGATLWTSTTLVKMSQDVRTWSLVWSYWWGSRCSTSNIVNMWLFMTFTLLFHNWMTFFDVFCTFWRWDGAQARCCGISVAAAGQWSVAGWVQPIWKIYENIY